MADIIMPDRPRFFDDRETYIRSPVRTWTWEKFAEQVNWMMFYARRVMPYTRIGDSAPNWQELVYPVDLPTYSTRYLTVMVGGLEYAGSAGIGEVTITTTTDSTGVAIKNFVAATGGGGSSSINAAGTEEPVKYGIAHVEITGDTLEVVRASPDGELTLDGWGMWELPAGMVPSSSAGIRRNKGLIDSTWTDALDPADYRPGAAVDTDIDDIQTSLERAEGRNQPILFAAGTGSDSNQMRLHTDSPNNTGSYVQVPTGGIYIPPTGLRLGATSRAIKIACFGRLGATPGTGTWTVTTSTGTYGSTSITTTAGAWSSPVTARLGTAGEWISIDLREDAGNTADPEITAVVIWDAGA